MATRAIPADLAPRGVADRFFEFSLLGLLTSGYLAVAGSGCLDQPTILLTAAGLLLRALLVTRVIRLEISSTLASVLSLAYVGFYPLDYFFVSRGFMTASVHLIFFLAIAKILTARSDRDYFFVKVIAFLELLAACILSSSLSFFVFLALFLLFGVAAFSSSEVRGATAKPVRVVRAGTRAFGWRLTALTVFTAVGILSLTAGLFFFLPRTARAAFQHLVSDRYRLPGFSNEVTLGQIGEIKQQSTPVMHVRMNTSGPLPELKWRGSALAEFDGRRWYNLTRRGDQILSREGIVQLADLAQLQRRDGKRIAYEVHLKEIASDALFFPGIPESLQIGVPMVVRSGSGGLRAPRDSPEALTYAASSFLEGCGIPNGQHVEPYSPPPLLPEERQLLLRLPDVDPRIALLTREISGSEPSEERRARSLQNYLRNNYGYTLELLRSEVRDPLAYFLFERRKGHCEYFASAMAVMLRTIGIPSRVVTGFQSGIYNPISGWQLIRASDAHSWVEAWFPSRGWMTFDPTPPDPGAGATSPWSTLALYLDAAEVFWQDWVLNYDLNQQLILASKMGESSRKVSTGWFDRFPAAAARWSGEVASQVARYGPEVVVGLVFAVLSFFFGPRLWRHWQVRQRVRRVERGEVHVSDATLLYVRMLDLLKSRGMEKPVWLTPFEFARVIPASETALLVEDLTVAYNDLRFGGNRDAAQRIMRLLDRLEKTAP